MKRIWRRHCGGILLSAYLAGLVTTPGFLWYRAGCGDLEPKKDAYYCVTYGTLLWPLALSGIVIFKTGHMAFKAWSPA